MPELPAAGIYLREFRRQMERDRGGVVGSDEVAQTLADSPPHSRSVGAEHRGLEGTELVDKHRQRIEHREGP